MKKSIIYLFFIFAVFSTAGCRKFVELDPPTTLLVTENVFQADATAINALTGLYTQMVDKESMPFILGAYTGYEADELNTSSQIYKHLYQNALQPIDAFTNQIWLAGYNYIYQANAIYEGCDRSNALTPAVKKQLMAEALFIRAFWHLYFVNLYGEIPIVTTTSYETNRLAKRSAVELVYQQIFADLKYAQTNLNENYVASNSTATSTDRVRPNKASATALLARAYLYHLNYADAEAQSSLVIQNSSYAIEDILKAFLAPSKEAIWQLMKPSPTNNINTREGYNYILTAKPGASLRNTFITPQLLNAFDSSDLRLKNWIKKFTDVSVTPAVDYYFPYKYKVQSSGTVTEHSIVLRFAEQFLIRAEARAQLNNLSGAIDDVDVIRKRAGLSLIKDINPGISKADLLIVILKERQRELFAEWGHRWIDLKRSGTVDAVMNVLTPLKGGVWSAYKQLWPIPETEIGNDPNLVQNPGYN